MLEFKPVSLADREIITSFTLSGENRDCNFSFANLCSWNFLNDYHYAVADGFLIIRFYMEDNRMAYIMPMGTGNMAGIIEKLEEEARGEKHPLCIYGVFPGTRNILDKYFPTLFEYTIDRDYFDYLYLREELVELKGKNYQSKRNHVNKFRKEYEFRYTDLTPEMVPQCMELEAEWCKVHGCSEDESLENERRALTYALEHYEELGLTGGAIWVDDAIVAFTYGAPITHDTFGVHVEKADQRVDGAYNMINQEFARHLPEQYIYLNREEDLGIPGLRKSKLSYNPVTLLEKGLAIKQ